jgi:hypothetical protein
MYINNRMDNNRESHRPINKNKQSVHQELNKKQICISTSSEHYHEYMTCSCKCNLINSLQKFTIKFNTKVPKTSVAQGLNSNTIAD